MRWSVKGSILVMPNTEQGSPCLIHLCASASRLLVSLPHPFSVRVCVSVQLFVSLLRSFDTQAAYLSARGCARRQDAGSGRARVSDKEQDEAGRQHSERRTAARYPCDHTPQSPSQTPQTACGAADWASLPEDIANQILCTDLGIFGLAKCVCKTWNAL